MNPRLTFILLVTLVVVGGYVYLYEIRKPVTRAELEPYFYTAEMSQIARVSFTQQGKTVKFAYNDAEQRWEFDDGTHTPVDTDRWGGITLLLSGPRAARVIMDSIDDPAKYGLDNPQLMVNVTLEDGRDFLINIGNPTPDGTNSYAILRGTTRLVTVNKSWNDVFTRLVTEPPYLPTPTPTPLPETPTAAPPTPAK